MYNWPQRKNQRLKNYDYSQNWYYFVTICTKDREDFFWEIIEWKMILNEYWKIAENEILKTEEIRKEIKIDIFVIMPNHLHLLVVIGNDVNTEIVGNTGPCSLQMQSCSLQIENTIQKEKQTINDFTKNNLSNAIQRIKSSITKEIRNKYNDFIFWWQKSFFDKIIKNDEQLNKTREYIINNPLKWEFDKNNPINIK